MKQVQVFDGEGKDHFAPLEGMEWSYQPEDPTKIWMGEFRGDPINLTPDIASGEWFCYHKHVKVDDNRRGHGHKTRSDALHALIRYFEVWGA